MREEWKCASMRHGEQFVATLIRLGAGVGTFQKLMLSANSLDTQQLVREFIIYFETIDMIFSIGNSAYSTFRFGNGALPVNIAYVGCKGTESSIANCTYSTSSSSISNCIRNYGRIGVQCRSSEAIIRSMI